MNSKEALDIITNSLNHATTKGAFNLVDCNSILQAIAVLEKVVEQSTPVTTPTKP